MWNPVSKHWRNDPFFLDSEVADKNFRQQLEAYANDIMSLDPERFAKATSSSSSDTDAAAGGASKVLVHRSSDGERVLAVQVSNCLTESDALRVQILASMIRDHFDFWFEKRTFTNGGGNQCTYLAPLLQHFVPGAAAGIAKAARLAWEAAGWEGDDTVDEEKRCSHEMSQEDQGDLSKGWINTGFPEPSSLGMRTSEHLSYDGWPSLEAHRDGGSVYTVNFALTEPGLFGGGSFYLQEEDEEGEWARDIVIRPPRLGAIVFLSETLHGVRQITSGRRETFVSELWAEDDAPTGACRPNSELMRRYDAAAEEGVHLRVEDALKPRPGRCGVYRNP